MTKAARLLEHLGHDVEVATYAEQNVVLECLECSEVIMDYDY